MTENDTTAMRRRQQESREARTAEIRRLLDQGGPEEVARRYGKSALGGEEFKAAAVPGPGVAPTKSGAKVQIAGVNARLTPTVLVDEVIGYRVAGVPGILGLTKSC
ncbi:hypothetical protein [Gordonia sp. SND2]|uniref:hypothetical protein n=1 Tax=Gordonia sp. SND2 TaxID=3388659 RepID=UPI00398A9F0D